MKLLKFAAIAACIIALSITPALAANTIKVGAILSVTGPASFLGAPEAKTLEMMVEDINAKGGINGNKVELVIKDSGGSPEKAVSFAKQLIDEDKVFAILGPSTSGETMAIKNIAEEESPSLFLRRGRGYCKPGKYIQDTADGGSGNQDLQR
jgi:branched-chain amino acid transport system substrate-binding protein